MEERSFVGDGKEQLAAQMADGGPLSVLSNRLT